MGRDLLRFRREAAHSPSRYRTRTPPQADEPAVWIGRTGGTDEFLGRRGLIASAVSDGKPSRRLTPLTCLAPPRADAYDGTSPVQQTRKSQQRSARHAKLKGEIFRIPQCAFYEVVVKLRRCFSAVCLQTTIALRTAYGERPRPCGVLAERTAARCQSLGQRPSFNHQRFFRRTTIFTSAEIVVRRKKCGNVHGRRHRRADRTC